MLDALCRWLTDMIVPDRALRVATFDDEVRIVVRPEIVEFVAANQLVPVEPEHEGRMWWPGLGIVAHRSERLEEFLARIEAECDNE